MNMISFRPATVECVRTEEAEVVNTNYKKMFSRPPTVGHFRVMESKSVYIIYIQLWLCVSRTLKPMQ